MIGPVIADLLTEANLGIQLDLLQHYADTNENSIRLYEDLIQREKHGTDL